MTATGEGEAADDKPVLLVVAHPAFEKSRANRALAASGGAVEGVTLHDLYEVYPDFLIDVDAEQRRLVEHRVIALQFPLYWYSTPSLLKEWIDVVWLQGFAYGRGGEALRGKSLFVACTAGSPWEDYRPGGSHHYSTDEFLRPLERTAALCHMRWEKPLVVHGSRTLSPYALAGQAEAYRGRLIELAGGEAR